MKRDRKKKVRWTEFQLSLSREDKVEIRFLQDHGKVRNFVIQYVVKLERKWYKVVRYDTHHGYAHKHVFHLKKKRYDREEYLGEAESYNEIYTEAYSSIKKDFRKIKENFLKS